MPSNAIDKDQNVGYTFSGGNATVYPHLYLDTLDPSGGQGTVIVVPRRSFTDAETPRLRTTTVIKYWAST